MDDRLDNPLLSSDLSRYLDIDDTASFATLTGSVLSQQIAAEAAFVIDTDTESVMWSARDDGEVNDAVLAIYASLSEQAPTNGLLSHLALEAAELVSIGLPASTAVGFPVGNHHWIVLMVDRLTWDDSIALEQTVGLINTLYRARVSTSGVDSAIESIGGVDAGSFYALYLDDAGGTLRLKSSCPEAFSEAEAHVDDLMDYRSLVDEADRPVFDRALDRAAESGTFEAVHRVHAGVGHPRWVRLVGAAETNNDGSIDRLVGVAVDLTEYHRRWTNLAKFREFIEQSTDAVYVIDRESASILDVNQSACEMLGYDREELLDLTVIDIDPEFTPELWQEFIDRVREAGSARIEVEHRCKDGTTIPVEIEVTYVDLDREYHIATVRDISERRRHRAALTEANRRYRGILDAVPDAIVVIDRSTLVIEDINRAAVALFGQPPDELVGAEFTSIIPSEDRDRFRSQLTDSMGSSPWTFRRYDTGEPLTVVRGANQRVPVSISCSNGTYEDTEYAFITLRDVSDQQAYEHLLESLSEASEAMMRTYSEFELAEIVVSTADEALTMSSVVFYRFDPDAYELAPLVTSDDLEQRSLNPLTVDASAAGAAFASGSTLIGDDGPETADAAPEADVVVPVGEYGVITAETVEHPRHLQEVASLLEVLASTAEAAFARNRRERELRNSERELAQKTRSLEQVRALNEQIRQLTSTLVRARSREEIDAAVCDQLLSLDTSAFVWVGGVDPIEEVVEPREWAGHDGSYFETISFSLTDDAETDPSVRAIRSGEPVYEPNCALDIETGDWRRVALRHSFKSMLSIPLAHGDVTQGVLTIAAAEPHAFGELLRSVYDELGTIVAHALYSLNRKQALISNQTIEIDFMLEDSRCFFLRAAEASGCEIELNGLIPQHDGTLVFISVTSGAADDLQAYFDKSPVVSRYRELNTEGDPLVQLKIEEPFIATQLAEYGMRLRRAEAGEGSCTLTIDFPPTIQLNEGVEIVDTFFEDATPVAKREHGFADITEQQVPDRYLGSLTDRQREAIELAFHRGYFDTPKQATGAEIADDMGISHSAFHNHLRSAEKQLFTVLFSDRQVLSDAPPDSQA